MFGPYGLPMSEMGSFNSSIRVVAPDNVVDNLQSARKAGAKVILRLAAGDLQNSNGTFSLTKWKAAVDRAAQADLSSYVRDGTFAGHLLILSPDVAGRWGGQRISHATLDEMARYSRSRWGAVPTIVEADAAWLGTTTAWSWLDGVWAIYSASAGDAATWVGRQASAAGRARLGIMLGHERAQRGDQRQRDPGDAAREVRDERDAAPQLGRRAGRRQPCLRIRPSSATSPGTSGARTSRVRWPSSAGRRRSGRPSRAEGAKRRSPVPKRKPPPTGGGFRFGVCGHCRQDVFACCLARFETSAMALLMADRS